jgi:hypothetical protein
VVGPFLVARRDTPLVLETVDEPLDQVAGAIQSSAKGTGAMLVDLRREGVPNAAPAQSGTDFPAAIALVSNQPTGTLLGTRAS